MLVSTFLIYLLLTLMITSTIFLVAMALRNNSIMDIAYGPVFLIATTGTILLTDQYALATAVAASLVALWSARLSLRILHKNFGKPEDPRYAAWREAWQQKGTVYFILRSYLQVFVLQGLVIVGVSTPLILLITYADMISWPWLVAGSMVWLVGLTIETTADWQLDAFIARKKAGTESANLMTTGLFRYSRRPNYFGESLIWWGFAVMALTVPYGWLGLVGPILITYIVTKVTGPMLERIFEEKYPDDFAAYKAQTSYFIPLPPRTTG